MLEWLVFLVGVIVFLIAADSMSLKELGIAILAVMLLCVGSVLIYEKSQRNFAAKAKPELVLPADQATAIRKLVQDELKSVSVEIKSHEGN